jgi:hypothetical protein
LSPVDDGEDRTEDERDDHASMIDMFHPKKNLNPA